jgi:hypothetical protein
MKFVWGLAAGALLVGFGVSLGKPSRVHRHKIRFGRRRFHRVYHGPQRKIDEREREALAFLREAREMIRELRTPNSANAEPTEATPNAGGKKE